MKIAYLTCVYPPYPGGIGVLAQGLAHEMARRGYAAEVFTLRPQDQEKEIAKEAGLRSAEGPVHVPARVKVNFIDPVFRYGHAGWVPHLARRLRGFDVVHLFYPFFGVAEVMPYLSVRTPAKIVVHHTMDAVATGWLGAFFKLYNVTLMPWIFKKAHLIITLSEDYFRECDLTAIYTAMPDAPPLDFVPNGVDVDRFRPISPIGPRGHISPIILFASGLDRAHYFKGVHVLIETMKMLKDKNVRCRCWIIGEGKMKKEYEEHARAAGLMSGDSVSGDPETESPYIQFMGLVPHKKMPDYYRQATVAVVPSTARVECFSIVAAEAKACGIPAVVSNFPGARVTVEDGKTGVVVRPGDPEELARVLEELLKNPQKIRTMGAAARKRAVALYDWKIIGDKLEKLYQSL